ncbi:Origin recognition complex subunit 1, partial [Paramuricea clavata]
TLEVMDLLSDEDVFQNDDNKSEASSYVSEEQTPVVDRKRANSKATPRTAGNRKISADQLNRRASGHKTNKAEANTSRECIEIDDDDIEEIENRDNNVSKSRKTTKQNSRVAQKTPRKEVKTPRTTPRKEVKTPRTTPRKDVKTPRTTPRKEVKTLRTTARNKEVKTPRKTPQKGMATSKTEETKSNKKKGRNIVTKDKGEKKKKQTNDEHSDDDSVEEYEPTNEEDNEESETEDEEELSESEELQSEEDEPEDDCVASRRKSRKKSAKTPTRSKKRSTTKRKQPNTTPKRKSIPSPKTPKSRRKSRLSFATPCIPVRAQSCKTPVTPLEKARASLHVSAVPGSLPCREQQFEDIYSFVEGKLSDDTGSCMYISGVPGTGKTATVHEVIRWLEGLRESDQVPDFKFYEINGMKVTQPNQVYVMFYKFLTGQKATADHASSLLDKYFNNPGKRKEHIILLVDELDQLWTRKQDVMYHLFDWPTRRLSKLIVLAIANTMDLPERMMINRVSSRLGLTRMTFQPYTYSQLQEIVTSRIRELDAFEPDAVQLVARKVAALSGDARRCLDICRRAVEIAEQEALSSKTKQELVGMPHVEKALNEMFSSPKIVAMKNLSMMEGYMLKSVLAEFRRTGLEEASFSGVYSQLLVLCRMEGVSAPASSLAFTVCSRLGAIRLLLVDSGRCDIQQRIRLNVNKDDILFALKTAKKETRENIGKSR